ncbi:hypothetical protein FE257_003811 [Aspergillus nanangensis]|uniref:Carrier domain-containing protein n=1 Tax=Aspergillus nanangensis TaxID=2582783 RepID=A0AAD4GNC4_ASPNN|nr:hypothetical protein FE257_003811 [Aspergillus nanangensis]
MIEIAASLANGDSNGCSCQENSSDPTDQTLVSPCFSFNSPQIPFHVYEGILLSAWVVLIRAYYGDEKTVLVRDSASHEEAKAEVECTTLSAIPETTAKELRTAVGDAKPNTLSMNLRDVQERAVVELILAVQPSREGAVVNVYALRDRKPAFQLCSMTGSLQKAVHSIMYYPSMMISSINIISDHDMARLQDWMVEPAYDSPNCIHALINRHYHEQPLSTAICSTTENITYEELGMKSAAIARALRVKGVVRGSIVGVRVAKSVAALVAIIGILRAGAGYVPMEPSTPVDRMQSILRKAKIKHLLADGSDMGCREGIEIIDPNLLEAASIPEDWKVEIENDPHATAYIMFTSGSTGLPKGVIHTQKRVAGGLLELADRFGLNKSTRFLQYASFSFDASICGVFAPLVVGATVCVPSDKERLEDIGAAMAQMRVTDASLTPVVIRQLKPGSIPSLKRLYVGGEAPSRDILEVWSEQVQLNNIYGTTETGVWDTIKPGLRRDDNPKNIGKGIGANMFVVDPSNIHKLQPIGVEGELLLQSPYIGKGYLEDPERQSKSFIPCPPWVRELGGDMSRPIYRTGDLVKCDPDGCIIFSGRESGFIKIRGLRIELGEVETCINLILEGGRTAVIAANLNKKAEELEIVAFVEASSSDFSLVDQLRSALGNKLPAYMIPSVIIPIESLPLTDSKKINRQSLHQHLTTMTPDNIIRYRPGGASAAQWKRIARSQQLAMELNHTIVDIVEGDKRGTMDSLRESDFTLSSVGLTSVQLVYMAGLIRRHWKKSLHLRLLQQPGLTVCGLAGLILNGESKQDETQQSPTQTNILAELDIIRSDLEFRTCKNRTVLCTSITGFLGSQILRSLLESPDIGRIIGLVRANSETKAMDKVREQGIIGHWWRDEYEPRIEIWMGDLSRSKLGLEEKLWNNQTGVSPIDAIVHNGARVNWMDDFATLKATNVQSTSEILEAIASMTKPCSLTYISGGYLPSSEESREEIAKKLTKASGYDQTKFLSRMLLDDYNTHLDGTGDVQTPRAHTIQPGFIVGTQKEGISHTEDFLWRLAATILKTRSISDVLRRAYIPVAGVDQIATLTVDTLLGRRHGVTNHVTDCRDGIFLFHFCDILSAKTGIKIQSVSDAGWMDAVRTDIENSSFDHPFLPVMDWFEANAWQFSPETCGPPERHLLDERETYVAIEKSVDYMVSIGYLPSNAPDAPKVVNGMSLFRRS